MTKTFVTARSVKTFAGQKEFVANNFEQPASEFKLSAAAAATAVASDFGSYAVFKPDPVSTVSDVVGAQPIIGYTENNVTVAERLATSPAQNAQRYAEAGTRDLIQRLIALNPAIFPALGFTGVNLRDIPISGYSKKRVDPDHSAPVTLDDMINARGPDGEGIFKTDDNTSGDAAGTSNKDQGYYFYRAVSSVDNNVIILRRIEARIAEYKQLADEAVSLLNQISNWQAQANARIAVLDGEITTAGHHIAVAQSLRSDELIRISAVNARRRAILDRVDVVLYHKPRLTDRLALLPTTKASSVGSGGALQLPLRDLESVPQEMSQMVQNFGAALLSWFPALDGLPQFFDRPVMLMTAFNHVRQRADVRLRASGPMSFENQTFSTVGKFQDAAHSMIKMQAARNLDWRMAGLQLDSSLIDIEGIAACHRRLRHAATLGDMIDGGHGSAKASKLAAEQLEQLRKASESLYASFADTPTTLRLSWAEALLDDNGQANFQALHTLPGWLSIDVDLKREQQGLVDLLYQQVHVDHVEAVAAINRLILVALLIASHAPVSQLISARMVRPIFAQPGVIFDLAMDVDKVRIGMPIIVQNRPGEISARAIIDDIMNGQVRARIMEVPKPNVTLAIDSIVHLSESTVFKSTVLGAKAVQFR